MDDFNKQLISSFSIGEIRAFSRQELKLVSDLFHHRAALFFTPTENIPGFFIGSGILDITLLLPIPNWTTRTNNWAYRIPRLWVDLIQQATGKIRWIPMNPARVTVIAYGEISKLDMVVGAKALIDSLKVSTYGRSDSKKLYYFGAIADDSPKHIDVEYIINRNEPNKAGRTRIVVESIKTLRKNKQ